MHDWLHRSPLGKYIRRYESRQGMTWMGKLMSIACMWIMICISAFLVIESLHFRMLLLALGAVGTASVLFIVPTAKNSEETKLKG